MTTHNTTTNSSSVAAKFRRIVQRFQASSPPSTGGTPAVVGPAMQSPAQSPAQYGALPYRPTSVDHVQGYTIVRFSDGDSVHLRGHFPQAKAFERAVEIRKAEQRGKFPAKYGRWVTMGGGEGEGSGGARVFIEDDGTIAAGPAALTGKKIGELKGGSKGNTEKPTPSTPSDPVGHTVKPVKVSEENKDFMQEMIEEPATIHKFEKAGLGKAPFDIVGVSKNVYVAAQGVPEQPGGTCDYCGTGIMWEHHIKSSDGKEFKVGSECVRRTHQPNDPILSKSQQIEKKAKKLDKDKRDKKSIEEGRALLKDNQDALSRLPHPHADRFPGQNKSLADYASWMFANAGTTGRLAAARLVKKALSESNPLKYGRWVTMNGGGEGSGSRVFLESDGTISAGPAALTGKKIGDLKKEYRKAKKEKQKKLEAKRKAKAKRIESSKQQTLLQAVRSFGGLNGQKLGFGERVNIRESMAQNGLLSALQSSSKSSGSYDLEEMADILERNGVWFAPPNTNKGDALFEALKSNEMVNSISDDYAEKQYMEYVRKLQEEEAEAEAEYDESGYDDGDDSFDFGGNRKELAAHYSRFLSTMVRAISTANPAKYGRWITIGGSKEEGEDGKVKGRGGARVYIEDNGTISAGPSKLEGKKIGELDKNVAGTAKDKRKDNEPPVPKEANAGSGYAGWMHKSEEGKPDDAKPGEDAKGEEGEGNEGKPTRTGMTRRERLEAKLEKRLRWAESRKADAERRFNTVSQMTDNIPLGQPILIGHHSEKGHRSHLARRDSQMTKGVESYDMSQKHTSKAAGIERQLEKSIFSDDDDAIGQIQEKIAGIEAEREKNSQISKIIRSSPKGVSTPDKLAQLQSLGVSEYLASKYFEPQGKSLLSHYSQKHSAEISRLNDRIKQIKNRNERSERAAAAPGGVLVEGRDYVSVTFPEKPTRETINALKAAGFTWGGGSWRGYRSKLPEQIAKAAEESQPIQNSASAHYSRSPLRSRLFRTISRVLAE